MAADLVIRGGIVFDGAGRPGRAADVAISGGVITEIAPSLRGGRELDAHEALAVHLVGEVVEPGALAAATDATIARVCRAPRDVLVRMKQKALRRAGFGVRAPTLDL